jgi:hypothetical protein
MLARNKERPAEPQAGNDLVSHSSAYEKKTATHPRQSTQFIQNTIGFVRAPEHAGHARWQTEGRQTANLIQSAIGFVRAI